jgi:hypothetical protein
MQRKATFKIFVTRREMLSVGDQLDHTLMLMEMEGEPVDYSPGQAGEFVSRRSVGFHDRIKGEGPMQGYAMTLYEHGAVFSRFEGMRKEGVTKGTWKVYKGVGRLANLQGKGVFTVKFSGIPNQFILDMEGEYIL